MKISIKSLTWNCEDDLGLWYHHYKERFPNANFLIYDNNSSDYTIELAQELGIKVVSFNTDNRFNDVKHRELKNQDFRDSIIIFGDIDELLMANEEDILKELELKTNIFRCCGYDIMEKEYKIRNARIDKSICWNSNEINPQFSYGAHEAYPKPINGYKVTWSSKEYPLFHNKYKSEKDFVERSKIYNERLEEWNRSVGHGREYSRSEEELRQFYKEQKAKAIKI